MILVVCGFHSVPFDRLIRWMDDYAARTGAKVVIQRGVSCLGTRTAESFPYVDEEEMDRLYSEADLVVCHAGVGSILDARRRDKPVILVPRRKSLNEHTDDHQMELATVLRDTEGVWIAHSVEELDLALQKAEDLKGCLSPSSRSRLVEAVREMLESVESELQAEGDG